MSLKTFFRKTNIKIMKLKLLIFALITSIFATGCEDFKNANTPNKPNLEKNLVGKWRYILTQKYENGAQSGYPERPLVKIYMEMKEDGGYALVSENTENNQTGKWLIYNEKRLIIEVTGGINQGSRSFEVSLDNNKHLTLTEKGSSNISYNHLYQRIEESEEL